MACSLRRKAGENWATAAPRLSPLGAHPARPRAPLARYSLGKESLAQRSCSRAGVIVPYVQDYYLWSLLKRLDRAAASVASQASGSDVALNITNALHRKKAATKLDSITANTVVVYI